MSDKIIQLNEEVVKSELKELVRNSVEETLNELLEKEADELTSAVKYERTEARQGYRSGHYSRKLTTTSGEVKLNIPKLKGVPFETAIIERYRRRESSVEEALIEMYLAGVSVRRVEHFEKGGEVLLDAFQPEEVAFARGVGHHGLQHLCCAVPVYGEYLRPFGDGPVDAADYPQLAGGNDFHAHRQAQPRGGKVAVVGETEHRVPVADHRDERCGPSEKFYVGQRVRQRGLRPVDGAEEVGLPAGGEKVGMHFAQRVDQGIDVEGGLFPAQPSAGGNAQYPLRGILQRVGGDGHDAREGRVARRGQDDEIACLPFFEAKLQRVRGAEEEDVARRSLVDVGACGGIDKPRAGL